MPNIKIGHIRLTVDPQQINIVNSAFNSAVAGIRSAHAQAVPTGYSEFGATMNVVFPTIRDINEKLRPIIALSKALPFVPIQSEDIADALVLGTEEVPNPASRDLDNEGRMYLNDVDAMMAEWAALIYRHFIIPNVKTAVQNGLAPNRRPLEVLIKAVREQYLAEFLPVDSVAQSRSNVGAFMADDIAQRKWYWNYVVYQGEGVINKDTTYRREDLIKLVTGIALRPGESSSLDPDLVSRWTFTAVVQNRGMVIDGDTIRISPTGTGGFSAVKYTGSNDISVRMAGYDAFETVPPDGKAPPESDAGDIIAFRRGQETHATTHKPKGSQRDFSIECKDALRDFIFTQGDVPTQVRVDVYDTDIFKRIVAIVTPLEGPNANKSANHEMLRLGLAIPYVVQQFKSAVADRSFLVAAKEAADGNVGLWDDDLWGGYHFRTSKRYPGLKYAPPVSETKLPNLVPRQTVGFILPTDYRSFGKKGTGQVVLGQRLYSNPSDDISVALPDVRDLGHAVGGEVFGDSTFDFNGAYPTFDSVEGISGDTETNATLAERVKNYYWEFLPEAGPRRWMPSQLAAILEERLQIAQYEREFNVRGPAHIFRSMADDLMGRARDDRMEDEKSYSRVRSKHFPGNYVPMCFEAIQINNVPDQPQALQATFKFTYFNPAPYIPIFAFIGTQYDKDSGSLMADDTAMEIDLVRCIAFLEHLDNNYLIDSHDNRADGRYIRPYSVKGSHQMQIEYVTTRLMIEAVNEIEANDRVLNRTLTRGHGTSKHRALITSRPTPTQGELNAYQIVMSGMLIDGIAVNFINHIPRLPMEGVEYPTAQFTGRGQGTAQIAFRTSDRRAIRGLHHMRALAQEAARLGGIADMRNSVIKISHPLLNITGVDTFIIDNIQEDNDPQSPDFMNITIDLTESAPRQFQAEKLTLVDIERSESVINDRVIDVVIDEMLFGSPDVSRGMRDKLIGPVKSGGVNVKGHGANSRGKRTIKRASTEGGTVEINRYTLLKQEDYAWESIGADFGNFNFTGRIRSDYIDPSVRSVMFGLLPFLCCENDPTNPRSSIVDTRGKKFIRMGEFLASSAFGTSTRDSEGNAIVEELLNLVDYRSQAERKGTRKFLTRLMFESQDIPRMFFYVTTNTVYEHNLKKVGGYNRNAVGAGVVAGNISLLSTLLGISATAGSVVVAGSVSVIGAGVYIIQDRLVSLEAGLSGGDKLYDKDGRYNPLTGTTTTALPFMVPDSRLAYLQPPEGNTDWFDVFFQSYTNWSYDNYCASVGQDKTKAVINKRSRIDNDIEFAVEETGDKIVTHGLWAWNTWGDSSSAPERFDRLIGWLYDEVEFFKSVEVRHFLRYLFKLSLKFESYRSYFYKTVVEWLPHLADELDGKVFTGAEPTLYADIGLPTYAEVYGRTHVPDRELRQELYTLAVRFVGFIGSQGKIVDDESRPPGDINTNLVNASDAGSGLVNLMERSDPGMFTDAILRTCGLKISSTEADDPLDPLAVFNNGAVMEQFLRAVGRRGMTLERVNRLHTAASDKGKRLAKTRSRIQLEAAWVRIIEKVGEIKSSFYREINIPEGIIPTFRDLGSRGPHAFNLKADARTSSDVVEPGWMYYAPRMDTWGQAESLIGDTGKAVTDIWGIGPEDDGDAKRREHPLRIGHTVKALSGRRNWGLRAAINQVNDISPGDGDRKQDRAGKFKGYASGSLVGKKPGAVANSINEDKKLAKKIAKDTKDDEIHVVSSNITSSYKRKNPAKNTVRHDVAKGRASSPGYPNARFGTRGEQEKIIKRTIEQQPRYPQNMRFAYPTAAIYFVEEDKETWGFYDDYYRFDSIVSIEVIRDKKVTDLAIITLTNMTGILSNAISRDRLAANSGTITQTEDITRQQQWGERADTRVSGGRNGDFTDAREDVLLAFKIKQGTRIIVKMGYSTKAIDLPTVFTGQVAEVAAGPIITIVAQAYDYQLTEPMYEKWGKAEHAFPEIIQDMLAKVNHFGGYAFYRDRLKSQTENRGTKQKGTNLTSARKYLNTTTGDNLYVDRSGWWGNFGWRIAGDDWIVAGPMLESLYSMTRYKPQDIMTVLPYDGRATLYFGPPDGTYMFTSRAQATLLLWKARRELYNTMRGSGYWRVRDGGLGGGDVGDRHRGILLSTTKKAEDKGPSNIPEEQLIVEETGTLLGEKYSIADSHMPNKPIAASNFEGSLLIPTGRKSSNLGEIVGRPVIDIEKAEEFYQMPNYYPPTEEGNKLPPRLQSVVEHIEDTPDELVTALFSDLIFYSGRDLSRNSGMMSLTEKQGEMRNSFLDNPEIPSKGPQTLRLVTNAFQTEKFVRTYGVRKALLDIKPRELVAGLLNSIDEGSLSIEAATDDIDSAVAIAMERSGFGFDTNEIDDNLIWVDDDTFEEVSFPGSVIKKYLIAMVRAIYNVGIGYIFTLRANERAGKKTEAWFAAKASNPFKQWAVSRELNARNRGSTYTCTSIVFRILDQDVFIHDTTYLPGQIGLHRFSNIGYHEDNWAIWNLLVGGLIPYLDQLPAWVANNPDEPLAKTYRTFQSIHTNNLPPNMMPLRDRHLVRSGVNLISNQITATRSHMGNIAVVESPGGEPSITSIANGSKVKMPKTKYIHRCSITHEDELIFRIPKYFYDINAYHNGEAWQVAMCCLGEALREMYQGQIVILGDPKIKPYDIVTLFDHKNIMNGSFEASRVVHHFSHDTGFVTTVNPHMIVHVNRDTDWWSSLLTTGLFTMATFGAAATVGIFLGGGVAGAGLVLGIGAGMAQFADMPTAGILGFQIPWFSGQAKIGPSRHHPVRISPMMHKGQPYIAGLEGWDKYAYNPEQSGFDTVWETAERKFGALREGYSAAAENIDRYWSAFWYTNKFAIDNLRDTDYDSDGSVD